MRPQKKLLRGAGGLPCTPPTLSNPDFMRRFHPCEADSENNGSPTSRARNPCNVYLRRRQYTAAAATGVITLTLWIIFSTHSGTVPAGWGPALLSTHRYANSSEIQSDSSYSARDAAGMPQIRPLPPGIDPADSPRACPVPYPRPTAEQTASVKHVPYLFGGQSPQCKKCHNDDDWSKFCRVRTFSPQYTEGLL